MIGVTGDAIRHHHRNHRVHQLHAPISWKERLEFGQPLQILLHVVFRATVLALDGDRLPKAIETATEADAVGLIGKTEDTETFSWLTEKTLASFLIPRDWLAIP